MPLPQKVVLVTGASSGIGQRCAAYLVRQGYRVFGTSRKATFPIEARPKHLRPNLTTLPLDVNDRDSVAQAVAYVLSQEPQLDVLVNNAGFGIAGALEDTSLEEAKAQFETNFFGVLRVCQAVLPQMRQQDHGHIINISSIAGLIGIPFQSMYSASKFALEGAMEALRLEVAPFGIRVVLVEPGNFNTDFVNRRRRTQAALQGSVYEQPCRKALQTMELDERQAPPPDSVSQLVAKIIKTDTPRLRYPVGRFSDRMALVLKRWLPDRLFERAIKGAFKLD